MKTNKKEGNGCDPTPRHSSEGSGNKKKSLLLYLKSHQERFSVRGYSIKFNVAKTTVYDYLFSLFRSGFVKRENYGNFKITPEGEKHLLINNPVGSHPCNPTSHPSKKEVRGHGFVFTLQLPNLEWWKDRESYLVKNNIEYKRIPQGQRLNLTEAGKIFKVWLCNGSIVVYFPEGLSFFATNSTLAEQEAIGCVMNVIYRLGKLFKFDFKPNLKISRNHYSLIENELAQYCNRKKLKIQITGDDNNVFMIVDNSYNLNETEFVSPIKAKEDSNRFQPYFNDLRNNPDIMLPSQMNESLLAMATFLSKQGEYAENIKAHIQSIKDLGSGVNRFNDSIGIFMGLVNVDKVKKIKMLIKNRGDLDKNQDLFMDLNDEEKFEVMRYLIKEKML